MHETTAARLAAQFSRACRHAATVEEIATDAVSFARAAHSARKAMLGQRSTVRYFSALDPIASKYQAEVVRQCDPAGMAVGLKFSDGSHASGFRNIFFVA